MSAGKIPDAMEVKTCPRCFALVMYPVVDAHEAHCSRVNESLPFRACGAPAPEGINATPCHNRVGHPPNQHVHDMVGLEPPPPRRWWRP